MKKILFSIMMLAAILFSANVNAQTIFDDFETDEGNYARDPGNSGSSKGLDKMTSTAVLDANVFHNGAQSQVIVIKDDAASTDDWYIRYNCNAGDPSDLFTEASGLLGLWLKTSTAPLGAKVGFLLDETATADGEHYMETSTAVDIVNDDAWHLYTFNLADESIWNGWIALTGDGVLAGALSIDAIEFYAPDGSDDWTFNIDDIGLYSTSTAINNGLSLNSAKIFPTVTYNTVTLQFNLDKAKNISLELFDYQGRQVYTKNMNVTAGGTRYEIDMSNFASSMYIAKLKGDNFDQNIKIIKK